MVAAVFVGFYLFRKYRVPPELKPLELPLQQLDGSAVDISAWKGHKTLLCFAASWCGPCREELAMLTRLQQNALNEIEILVVSDEPAEQVEAFKNRTGGNFTWLRLTRPFSAIGINSIPSSYMLNARGEVVKSTVGYVDWEDPSTRRHLLKLME